MRAKRKNYDDQSSDYGNEHDDQDDYEEDDYDEDEQPEESDGDSAYGESGNERVNRHGNEKIKSHRSRYVEEAGEEDEGSYEDEDPFLPEIDQILADKQIDIVDNPALVPQGHSKTTRQTTQLQQQQTTNIYLIKFESQSYVHVKWMTEQELEDYSYKAKQKIRRYWIQKQRKRAMQDHLQSQQANIKQRNHHFSDDEEEDEDEEAALRVLTIVDIPVVEEIDQELYQKPKTLKVVDDKGEDLTQYFDKNYIIVERILSTSCIFPVIHPRQASQVRGRWQEDCLKVMNVLINFKKNNVCIGLSFADEDLADYFKVIKQPIDFVMIMNRLYNKYYQEPKHFWNELGLVFKNCRQYYKNIKLGLRKQCDSLRVLAYYLYLDWHNEQSMRFTTGLVGPPQIAENQQAISKSGALSSAGQSTTTFNIKQDKPIGISPTTQQQSREGQQKDSLIVNLTSLLQNQSNNPSIPLQQQNVQIGQANQQNQMQNPQNQQLDFWNALTRTQNESQQQQQISPLQNQFAIVQQQQQQNFQTPNLSKLNQMMNRLNNMPQPGFQDLFQSNMMNQMNPLSSSQMGFNQFNNIMNPNLSSDFMHPQESFQQNIDQGVMKQFFNQQSLGSDSTGTGGIQLPSLQQLSQMQNPFGQQNSMMGMQNPYINMMEINQMQYQLNPFNKQMSSQDQFSSFGGGNQGSSGMLPSLSQMPGMGGNFSLPSLNQFSQNFGSGLNDPYNLQLQQQAALMGMMQQPQNYIQQQQMLENLSLASQLGLSNIDDFTLMMLKQQLQQQQQQQFGSIPNLNMFSNDSFRGMNMNDYTAMSGLLQQQQQMPMLMQQPQPQGVTPTSMQVESLLQADNDNYNENQEQPVPPAITDPGPLTLSWILDINDSPDELQNSPYISREEIDYVISRKNNVDQLYLVKWRSLSYVNSTWEPESLFRDTYEEKIQDYLKFNRSLDQQQRDRLDQINKNHKKMLRLTEKKSQQVGKKLDENQYNNLALQESRLNRSLLNQKIQELMGTNFYSYFQYSDKRGVVPTFKKPQYKLKDYQIQGLNWLIRAWHEQRNVVLADEMGLGKTIMTLSFFDHITKFYKLRGPFLILAPLTTLEHWKRIADEWTNLNSVLYYDPGSAEGRNEIRQWEWHYTDITYKGTITTRSELFKFNVIITSFEVFVQDLNPILQEIPFIYIVVDEAHRLKNKQAKTLKMLKDHPCKRILLLTGTPVQNNTKELWTLLNYIEPEKFRSLDDFLDEFGNLETYEQITKLHQILRPHFLRRLKEEVDNSIPPLQETVIEVGLTNLQNAYYKGIYGENRMLLSKFGTNSIKTSQLNNIDVQLRKCCNHLFLLKGVEEELTKDCKDEEDLYKKLLESSGKLMLLNKFIDKFKQENHKVLIFSQFKRMLEIIEWYLRMKAVPYEMLTGSVKTADRISSIQRFNEEKTFGVFLLTTRAGGLGINLTSARVVIIFDSDWNPQNDLQAIARAHRIGQRFEVQVYRLITSKTYEEQMFERASKKLGMEQALFSKGAFNQNEDPDIANLSLRGITEMKHDSKEIENLLKYGAYAFIDNEDDDQQNLNNKDIDEILATGKKKEFCYNKGVYTLQKSTFNASKYEKLPKVDDPEFWNKVLPFESIISISVLEKRFKKEKRDLQQNDKMQKEFVKDLEIVFNDFMDAKFDSKTSNASKKQFESDEEKLREILKKIARMNGFKLLYQEKCKEWLTNKRKKPIAKVTQGSGEIVGLQGDDDDEGDADLQEDDIMMDDSEDDGDNKVKLRKRTQKDRNQMQEKKSENTSRNKRGRKPRSRGEVINFDKQSKMRGKADSDYDDEYGAYGDEVEEGEATPCEGEEDDLDYGEEEDQKIEDYGDEDDSEEPETRYGLRGRTKRQKTSKNETGAAQARTSNHKVGGDLQKRNEKNGIVCSYCLRAEPPYCSWFCHGYCQRYFHSDCKDTLFQDSSKQRNTKRDDWICDDCQDNKAICFCCKQKSQILIIPKKGKPKAPGQPDEDIGLEELNPEMHHQDVEEDDEEGSEDFGDEDLADEDLLQDENNGQEEALEVSQKIEQLHGLTQEVEGKNSEFIQQELQKGKEEEKQGEVKQSQNKIVINTATFGLTEQPQQSVAANEAPKISHTSSTKIVLNTALVFKDAPEKVKQEEPEEKKYVVRCTLGGCFKYYHVSCVYKNKNVSCINSMKVQRFRCPLHYCEICQVSGDSVLIVQCVTCPTAYHLKCLYKDTKSIRLTKKYIICGKHNMSQNDFPKYEEKSGYQQSQIKQSLSGDIGRGPKDKRRKFKKKRGRRPKNYGDDEYESELPQTRTYYSQSVQEGSTSFVYSKQKESKSIQNQLGVKLQKSIEVPKPLFQITKYNRIQQ